MQTFIGFDDGALKYNREYVISTELPSVAVYRDVFVSPIWPTIEGNFLEEVGGGAFDHEGRLIAACSQPRSENHNAISLNQAVALPTSTADRIPKAVFGGIAFDHFGHFLLETSARLWCRDQYRDLPWLFLTNGQRNVKTYQRDFLSVLGLSSQQILPISEWHRVDELVIPEPSFIYHHYATHAFRDTFRKVPVKGKRKGRRKIFISRTNITMARTVGEQELESILAGDGWEIVLPEKLPAAEQAALFRHDNIILGLQGSAMHLGLFAPDGRKIVHLCRGLGYRGYYLLDDLVQADATYFNAMREHELPAKPIRGPFLLDLDRTLAFLREQDLLSQAAVTSPGIRSGAELESEYTAWWHHTESQVRFHHQQAHDGSPVAQITSLDSALSAVELKPQDPTILGHAIALLLKFKGVEAAGELVDRHCGENPPDLTSEEDAQLLYHISLIRDARQDYEDAATAAARAVALVPDNGAYANQYATVLYRMGRYDEVEALLTSFIAREGGVAGNHFILSLVAEARGDHEAAIRWAKTAVESDRSDENCCKHLARLLVGGHREREALEAYQRYLERRPGNVGALIESGNLAKRLGDSDLAAAQFLEAYHLAPDDPQILERTIAVLTELGRLPDLMALEGTASPSAQRQSVTIYQRSMMLADAGSLDEARKLAMLAVEMFPTDQTIVTHLMGVMIRQSKSIEARLFARVLVDHGRESAQLMYALSLAESNLGNAERAKSAAGRAVELAPEQAIFSEHYQRF